MILLKTERANRKVLLGSVGLDNPVLIMFCPAPFPDSYGVDSTFLAFHVSIQQIQRNSNIMSQFLLYILLFQKSYDFLLHQSVALQLDGSQPFSCQICRSFFI